MIVLIALVALLVVFAAFEAITAAKDFTDDRKVEEQWVNRIRLDPADGFQSARLYWFSIGWKLMIGSLLVALGIWI